MGKIDRIVSQGDLAPNMYVTVTRWIEQPAPTQAEVFTQELVVEWMRRPPNYNRSYCGDVLQVLAVNLPYVALRRGSQVFSLNTTEVELMELTDEYVESLEGRYA